MFVMRFARVLQESVSDGSAQFEVTRSLVCVWVASNVKFIFFKSNNHPLSLSAHSISRLVVSAMQCMMTIIRLHQHIFLRVKVGCHFKMVTTAKS